jgi:hypothetical protein
VGVYLVKGYAPFEFSLVSIPFQIEEEEDEDEEDEDEEEIEEEIGDLVHDSESD